MVETYDITPSPRILRMLGQIEFKPWQCLAELIDNSIDSFLEGRRKAMILQPEITISLPTSNQLKAGIGQICLRDNGVGMKPEQLRLAVKAGYSGNTPIDKLGLFGMGFNIATARLGGRTEVWTISPDEPEWTGVVIDFQELEKSGVFVAPKLTKPRGLDDQQTHGTEIIISKLDENRVRRLTIGRGKSATMQKLGRIYSPLIQNINLDIKIDGEQITATPHCVWSENRRVETSIGPVSAKLYINEIIGARPYCTTCWVWLNEGEDTCPICSSHDFVETRQREVKGWIGIQRFFDLSHYGIDLIRNGRVIEELDKNLFYWENPDLGDREKEYPIDTIHWGGRIVGELEIDFVRISHQKDAFDKNDPQWQLVVKAVRGDGPLRPQIASRFGYPPNDSPLARLFTGYRTGRTAGLQYLVPGDVNTGKGMNEPPKEWAEKFWAGDPEYQSDEKWYAAVLAIEEVRRKPSTQSSEEVKEAAGEAPFDTTDEGPEEPGQATIGVKEPEFEDDFSLSGTYELSEINGCPTLTIRSRRLISGQLPNNQAIRFTISGNVGIFEYKPTHDYFESSLDNPVNCLIRELSFQLLERSQESQANWPITRIETELKRRYFSDTLLDVDSSALQATAFLEEFREFLSTTMPNMAPISDAPFSEYDRDIIRTKLLIEGQASETRVNEIITTGQFPRYLNTDFLPRAIMLWPETILDGNFLSVAYSTVNESIRPSALEQVVGSIRDVVWLCEQASIPGMNRQQWREQLARAIASLHLLQLWRA